MDRAEKRIFEIAQQKVTGEITSLGSVAESVYEMLEDRGRGGLMTDFVDMDEMLHGLQPGEMVIVAAPAEHGQDGVRHERRGERGGQERAGRRLLARNEQAAARPANDVQPRPASTRSGGPQGDAPQRGVPEAGDDGDGNSPSSRSGSMTRRA